MSLSSRTVNLLCDGFEMCGVDASCDVAQVINHQAFGNRPDKQFIGDAMRQKLAEVAVSECAPYACPEPAGIRSFDALPKRHFERQSLTNYRCIQGELMTPAEVVKFAESATDRWRATAVDGAVLSRAEFGEGLKVGIAVGYTAQHFVMASTKTTRDRVIYALSAVCLAIKELGGGNLVGHRVSSGVMRTAVSAARPLHFTRSAAHKFGATA